MDGYWHHVAIWVFWNGLFSAFGDHSLHKSSDKPLPFESLPLCMLMHTLSHPHACTKSLEFLLYLFFLKMQPCSFLCSYCMECHYAPWMGSIQLFLEMTLRAHSEDLIKDFFAELQWTRTRLRPWWLISLKVAVNWQEQPLTNLLQEVGRSLSCHPGLSRPSK